MEQTGAVSAVVDQLGGEPVFGFSIFGPDFDVFRCSSANFADRCKLGAGVDSAISRRLHCFVKLAESFGWQAFFRFELCIRVRFQSIIRT